MDKKRGGGDKIKEEVGGGVKTSKIRVERAEKTRREVIMKR